MVSGDWLGKLKCPFSFNKHCDTLKPVIPSLNSRENVYSGNKLSEKDLISKQIGVGP